MVPGRRRRHGEAFFFSVAEFHGGVFANKAPYWWDDEKIDQRLKALWAGGTFFPRADFSDSMVREIQDIRHDHDSLDDRLVFWGTYTPSIRRCANDIYRRYANDVDFKILVEPRMKPSISADWVVPGLVKEPFNDYLRKTAGYKVNLSLPGSEAFSKRGKDVLSFREYEFIKFGLPFLRVPFEIEFIDPLIPDTHYIAIDVDPYDEFDVIATQTMKRFYEVRDDREFLASISKQQLEFAEQHLGLETFVDFLYDALHFERSDRNKRCFQEW